MLYPASNPIAGPGLLSGVKNQHGGIEEYDEIL